MFRRRQALFAGLAMLSTAAFAGTPTGTEILFGSASFDDVKVDTTLTYTHNRLADENIPVRAIEDGSITVSQINGDDGTDKTVVTLLQGKIRRQLDHLPADRGNPIFVVFLESSVSSVTFATKGSPFYIRNRMKEAFASGGEISEGSVEVDGKEIDATHIDYWPFKGDRNAKQMGIAFENLLVRFTLSDTVPGHFVQMTTQAKVDGTTYFSEEVRFDGAKDEEK